MLVGLPNSLSLDIEWLDYLTDPGVWGKFFVAISEFMLAEHHIELRPREKLRQVLSAMIIPVGKSGTLWTVYTRLQSNTARWFRCKIGTLEGQGSVGSWRS